MKRIISILLIAVFAALMLTACGADPLYNKKESEAAEQSATEDAAVDIENYTKDFKGLQKYLQDLDLIPKDDSKKTDLYADILGAEKAVRYTLNSSAFIEFYSYGEKKNEIAKMVFDQIEKEGTFEIAGLEPLTGVVSDSGKYLAVYNAKINYDYDKIVAQFKKY